MSSTDNPFASNDHYEVRGLGEIPSPPPTQYIFIKIKPTGRNVFFSPEALGVPANLLFLAPLSFWVERISKEAFDANPEWCWLICSSEIIEAAKAWECSAQEKKNSTP